MEVSCLQAAAGALPLESACTGSTFALVLRSVSLSFDSNGVTAPRQLSQPLQLSSTAQRMMQMAKSIWERMKADKDITVWFDYSASGDKQICLMFTKVAPIGPQKAIPPWEPGSLPPPFLVKLQQEAAAREAERAATRSAPRGRPR